MDDLHPSNPTPGARRVKRRLVAGLLALNALSLLAGGVLLSRSKNDGAKSGGDGGKSLLLSDSRDAVGWVSVRGPIYASASSKPWERGSEQIARRIEQLADMRNVKAIVLDINSPGGSVGAVQEIYSRIQRVKRERRIPFVALFGDVAASGGYYIASACDKIVAHPGTLTGSIGVIFQVSNMEGLFEKVGFKMDPIKSGRHKDIGSPARAMTLEERRILQALIDDAYEQFVQAVADGRKLPLKTVKPLADGRIYSGHQAVELRLVDQLGDSRDALMLAARMGGIKDAKPRVKREVDPLDNILGLLESRAPLAFGVGPVTLPLPDALSAQAHGMLYMWSGR